MRKFLFTIFFCSLNASADTGFDFFKNNVHSTLVNKCGSCHGDYQQPLHSVTNPEHAYPIAKQMINLRFPEQSPLWIRSYNNHCGQADFCSTKDDKLFNAIKSWINIEADKIATSPFVNLANATITIPPNIKDESVINLTGPNGELYSFKVNRFSDDVIFFHSPSVAQLKSGLNFDGFEINSNSLLFKSQHFRELKIVVKPTQDRVNLANQGGYAFAILPDKSLSKINISLDVAGYEYGKTYEQLKKLYEKEGFDALNQQMYFVPKVTEVINKFNHTCVKLENETYKCWGANDSGQLGLGDTNSRGLTASQMGASLPTLNLGDKIISLGVGFRHSCALVEGGKVKCWGASYYGQLGNEDTLSWGNTPTTMGANLPYTNLGNQLVASQLLMGGDFACVVTSDNRVKCWGDNYYGQLGLGDVNYRGDVKGEMGDNLPFLNFGKDKLKQLALGFGHSCALFESGNVKCWGLNGNGQTGSGNSANVSDSADETIDKLPFVDLGKEKVKKLFTGYQHTCALFENNKIKCWGDNSTFQLGLGDADNRGDNINEMGENLPYVDLGNSKVIDMKLGQGHTCAQFEDLKIKCWGNNNLGQLGLGTTINKGNDLKQMGDNLTAMDFGKSMPITLTTALQHSCVLLKEGTVKCWGNNQAGELGLGHQNNIGDSNGEVGAMFEMTDVGQDRKF